MLLDFAQTYRRSLAVKWGKDGMSQQEVARRLEVTQGAISQWAFRDREGGEETLKTQPRPGRPPRLTFAPVEQTPIAKGKRGQSPRHMVIGAVSSEGRSHFHWI
ncbi:helix-turn-helix domain-containing protein [Halomonas sp. M20]|uniref:helix-turn-helix domain-containing protein n=1 Tax=Halomonas sp. M20 TaxID=2763264 RepID=UPI001D0AFF5C|nr:helix-turn-helix domain-containing protein [Halomonas sp. M20]